MVKLLKYANERQSLFDTGSDDLSRSTGLLIIMDLGLLPQHGRLLRREAILAAVC